MVRKSSNGGALVIIVLLAALLLVPLLVPQAPAPPVPAVHFPPPSVLDGPQPAYSIALDDANDALVLRLKEEIRTNRIQDPYDARWWGKKLTSTEYNTLEQALDDFMNDTERDGLSEFLLLDTLRNLGINVTNLEDAVHAANHLVNNPAVPKGPEPLPPSVREDIKDLEGTEGGN